MDGDWIARFKVNPNPPNPELEMNDDSQGICPLCQTELCSFFINFNDKILMCQQKECNYPFADNCSITIEKSTKCPLCESSLRYFYINLKDKVLICENIGCMYPFQYELSTEINTTIIEKRHRKLCRLCQSELKLFYISLNEKLLMCTNKECEFPFCNEGPKVIEDKAEELNGTVAVSNIALQDDSQTISRVVPQAESQGVPQAESQAVLHTSQQAVSPTVFKSEIDLQSTLSYYSLFSSNDNRTGRMSTSLSSHLSFKSTISLSGSKLSFASAKSYMSTAKSFIKKVVYMLQDPEDD